MAFKYLNPEILQGFDKYKYSSVDTSPLSNYVMHPFWNWLVQFVPRTIAPNLMTFGGFMFLIVQFFIFTYYDPNFYASDDSQQQYSPMPSWTWLVAAICMFLAHQLDGMDGKQARRTGTSSPLGELFDHGLDSWAAFFMPVGVYSVFGRGEDGVSTERMYYVFVCVLVLFFASHWEKYLTGVLYLTWGYDISQICITLVYIATYIGGYQMWKFLIPFTNLHAVQAFEALMYASVFILGLPVCFSNIYVSYRDKTGKNLGLYEASRPLLPVIIEFISFTLWIKYSPYGILTKHPRLLYLSMGTLFSNITCRIIVNGMSNTRCQAFNWLLIPLIAIVVGVINLQLGVIEFYLLVAYAIFVNAAHIHYGICVVKELADHLNIYVFSIQRPPKSLSSAAANTTEETEKGEVVDVHISLVGV